MDKLISSLEEKEFVVGIFLDFSKAFDKLITWFCYKSCSIMESEVVHWSGLLVIYQTVCNMLLTMERPLWWKVSAVVFLKDQS